MASQRPALDPERSLTLPTTKEGHTMRWDGLIALAMIAAGLIGQVLLGSLR